jgi:predicted nucleic acid-binding protein
VIVVDVNVLAYLFIDGPQTAEVQALRAQDPEWAAPLLWRSEWRGILTGYLRRGDLDRALAIHMTETATRLLRGREYPVENEAVLDVVLGSSLSAYDAEYVATARTLGVPLYTYDRQVLDTFPAVARRP